MHKTDGLILKWIESLTNEKITKLSFYAAFPFVLSPLLVVLLKTFGVSDYNIVGIWVVCLYVSGGIGLFFGLIYIMRLLKNMGFSNILKNKFFEPLLFSVTLLAWIVVSVLSAPEIRMALYGYADARNCFFTFLFYGGIMLLGIVLVRSKKHTQYLLSVFSLVVVLLAIMSFFENALFESIIESDYVTDEGVHAVFYSSIHFLIFLIFGILCCLYKCLNTESTVYRIIFAMFSLTVFASILFVCHDLTRISNHDSFYGIVASYTGYWKNGISYIAKYPIIGVGPQNTLADFRNLFIQIAVYLGIPGLFLYLGFILSIVRIILKRKMEQTEDRYNEMFFGLSIFGYYFISFFAQSIFNIAPYIFLLIGLAINYKKSLEK